MNTKYVIMNTMNKELKFVKGIEIGEIWKNIPECNGEYQASTLGRVRSVDRLNSYGRRIKGKILEQGIAKGYLCIKLHRIKRNKTEYIHRIMYKTFIGEISEGMQVCHNDGDKLNNNIWNLRIDTQKGNERDKIAHGTITYGERNGCHKITENEVLEIRKRWEEGGVTMTAMAEEYDVQISQISRIINRKRWAWL
jgi:hypothetical protein